MPLNQVRVRFEEFLAGRPPLAPHHGLLLDTRTMPFVQGVAGSGAPELEVSIWGPQGRARWRFQGAVGQSLEIEVTLLHDDDKPPKLPEPLMVTRMLDYAMGPTGLGEFAIEYEGRLGHHIGWLRGNIRAAVRFGGLDGDSLFKEQRQALSVEQVRNVAARVDAWLASAPVVDLDAERWPLGPVLTPQDAVVGEKIRLTWRRPSPDADRFQVQVRDTWPRLRVESAQAQQIVFEAEKVGLAAADVDLIDRVTLLVSHTQVTYEVRDFAPQLARGEASELMPLIDKERPARSWRIVQQLCAHPLADETAAALAQPYAWWDDYSRRRGLAEALWMHALAHDSLLKDPVFQADLPRWIVHLASGLPIANDPPDVDGYERHRQVARALVSDLIAMKEYGAVTRLAAVLDPAIVGGTWKSFGPAFHHLSDHSGAIAVLERIAAGVSVLAPEHILWTVNVAVERMLSGDDATALFSLNEILDQSWAMSAADDAEPLPSVLARARTGDREAGRAYTLRLYLGSAHYNRACVHGRRGDVEGAVWDLAEARRRNKDGYSASKIAAERDFDRVRSSPLFAPFAH